MRGAVKNGGLTTGVSAPQRALRSQGRLAGDGPGKVT
jgi:hypothetical protein